MRILSAEQMREADRRTIEDIGIPSLVLMENAGRQVVAAMDSSLRRPVGSPGRRPLRQGQQRRRRIRRRSDAASARCRRRGLRRRQPGRDSRAMRASISKSSDACGITVVEIADESQWELHFSEISDHDLIVDALFGTGLEIGPVRDLRNDHRRHQRVSHRRRVDRPALRSVRRHERPDGRLHRGDGDGDARRAQAAVDPASGREQGRRSRRR